MTDERRTPTEPRALLLLLVALLPVAGLVVPLTTPLVGHASDCGLSFLGTWEWNQGGRGKMRVLFGAIEEEPESFEVEFRLIDTFDGATYQGTASGLLCEGDLEGRVQDAGGTRFGFRGAFADGEFRGEHFQLDNNDKEYDTGKLSFR